MKRPNRILVVRTDRIGDMILSLPVFANLRAFFPESYIACVCRPYTQDILKLNSVIDEVIVYDKYGMHKSFFSTLKFALRLRKKKFDWALVLHPTNRAHILAFLAGIPFRVGWDRKLGFLLTKKLPHTKQEGRKHESEYTLDILRTAGIEVIESGVSIPKDKSSEAWAQKFLKSQNIDLEKDLLIGFGIGASCPSKVWPPRFFAELAESLNKENNAKILVFAAEKEAHLVAEFKKYYSGCFHPIVGYTLPQLFSLFRKLSLFIGNDSGLVHMCWATDTPVISIFGRKQPGLSPQRWKPLGKDSFFLHKDIGCSPCLAHECTKQFACLFAVKPEEVLQLARKVFKIRRENGKRR